ncbi:MAG TPA: methionine--tRNA ligase [Clostridiales bacterium]|jgi:methionyl-tRNA synthetase|nr:methionine--tRNA ligase [Clostridiales bacterium]HCG35507.1 methionine--tRNA ligase [Clostridiales bacterium]
MKEKFYLTTAIAYTSRKPHIGNTYEVVFADAIARYQRLIGKDVFFLTGTDEHGIKIQECAEKAGIHPKEYVDKVAGEVREVWDLMNTTYDKFIRTTDEYHEKSVAAIFNQLYAQGDIYKSEYEGWYCTPCETFFTDSQIHNGVCPECGAEAKKAKEETYFFKMTKYQKQLEEYIEANPDFISPEARKKEMINNFLKPGLTDLCVSRTSFSWGIPVKFDPKHVIYVWLDALTNYITALGYHPGCHTDDTLFQKYWPCDVHIIGKDIVRFHTIYWPIFLMALGLPLPKKVFGHPWFLSGQDKMSKSKGNTIYADELVSFFGVDAVRFYLLSEMPYVNDGVITYDHVIAKFNAELANTLGNLVSRTLAMTKKYFGSVVPVPGVKEALDEELIGMCQQTVQTYVSKMDEYKTGEAVNTVFELLYRANKYIDETTPWILAKTEEGVERLKTVLYNLLEVLRITSVLLHPFMPDTSQKTLGFLGADLCWDSVLQFGGLKAGQTVEEGAILFARLDEKEMGEKISAHIDAKIKEAQCPQYEPIESEITIDDFSKVDLRVGTVLACEPVKKSDKLLCLQVDIGPEIRKIVSGIAKWYKPEELIGKKVILVANLKPVKLRGVESCGMILAAGEEDVKVLFASPDTQNGDKVR